MTSRLPRRPPLDLRPPLMLIARGVLNGAVAAAQDADVVVATSAARRPRAKARERLPARRTLRTIIPRMI